ncbi:MAG: tRNA epoxyqueuosine(34) reductase QueG [Acidimicrobiales bacterium]
MVTTDTTELKALALEAGLDAVGIAPAEPFEGTRRDLEQRKADGLHAGMGFTYRNPSASSDPSHALPGARAIVVGALAYPTTPEPRPPDAGPLGRVAAYARDDRYAALRIALRTVARRLKADGWRARVLVDDNALVDREAAHRAGIGWYGKSANLLLPGRGSWFVLGSVVTTAPLAPDEGEVADGCGSCRRCLDGCPTGAIVAPGVVDARLCLSWLLQQAGTFPIALRGALGDRIYGCDDCQEVCPPNRRAGEQAPSSTAPTWVALLELLDADDSELLERHGRWYIAQREPRWLRRNALVVLGNTAAIDDLDAAAAIERYRCGEDEMLAEHATWAAARIAARAAVAS